MIYWMMLQMIGRVAQKFVLTSRSGIKTNYQRFFFNQIDETGKLINLSNVQVKISIQNVIDEQKAKNVLDEAESMGKISAIFQLPSVLYVALLDYQTAETFNDVYKLKVNGTINLEKLSRQLPYQIDYLVYFPSIACGRGSPGQSNYGC